MSLQVWLPLNKDTNVIPDITGFTKEGSVTLTADSDGWYKVADSSHTSSRWGIYKDFTVKPNTQYTLCVYSKSTTGVTAQIAVASYDSTTAWPPNRDTNATSTEKLTTYKWTTGNTHNVARVYLNIACTATIANNYVFFKDPAIYEDFSNQGLANITASNYNASINDNGKIGKCYSFGTALSYMTIPKEAMTSFTTEASVSFLLKILTWNTNYATFFQAGLASNPWTSYTFGFLRNSSSSKCCFVVANGSSSTSTTCLTPTLELNKWYHISLCYKTGYLIMYINGELVNTKSISIVPNFAEITTIILGVSGNKSAYQSNCMMNDIRIYDHCLSPKEVKEISKGLILHYPLNDPYTESTTNLITTQDCLSATCYNGATSKYGYGTNTDMYKVTGVFNDKFCTKVYMGTSGLNAYPYVYVNNLYVSNGTNAPAYKTVSYDYYGTIGTVLVPYKLGSGTATCTWRNTTTGKSGTGGNSMNISVVPGIWNHIEMTLHGTTDANAEWGYIRLGSAKHTSDTSNYWLFANMQIETKDHATAYAGVGGTRNSTTIYDVSGYERHGTIVGTLEINNESPRYNYCIKNTTEYLLNSVFDFPESNGLTFSCWINLTTWGYQTSGLWATSTNSTNLPQDYNTTTCNHYDSRFAMRGTNGTTYNITCNATDIPANTWKHVVLTHDGANAKLYINGALTRTLSVPTPLVGFKSLFLGWSNAGGSNRKCQGSWSDFRMYATALSAEDVLELYNTAGHITDNGTFIEYELFETAASKLNGTGVLETGSFYENGADSSYVLGTEKTKVASNYIVANNFVEN